MYAEAELMFPLFITEAISPITTDDTTHHMGNLFRTSSISEYDLGGEGDLFKAPEPIIEESILPLDPMTAAMAIISNGGNVISETIKAADMESIQNEQLNDVFYDCKKDFLEKCVIDEAFPELSDFHSSENNLLCPEGRLWKSVSMGCLNSVEWVSGNATRPNFLDFEGMDFETVFGLRRAYSEGDIKTLGITNTSRLDTTSAQASFDMKSTAIDLKSEERQEKLSRYRKKRSRRNFGRTIKYACRKTLAEGQLRVRGRFARTEQCEDHL